MNARVIGLVTAILLATPANSETIDGARIVVIDGDTVALPCVTPGPGCSERVRLYNTDAPETRGATCNAELELGLAAKARLRQLLTGPVSIDRCEPKTGRCKDGFGRTLGALISAAGDIGQLLIAEGLAEPWRAGRKARDARKAKWCGVP